MSIAVFTLHYALQAQPGADCVKQQVTALYRAGKYAETESAALRCATAGSHIYYLYAGQAQRKLKKYREMRLSLQKFLEHEPPDTALRDEATEMLRQAPARPNPVKGDKPATSLPPSQPVDGLADPAKPNEEPAQPVGVPDPGAPAVEKHGGDATTSVPSPPVEDLKDRQPEAGKQGVGELPRDDRPKDEAQRRRRMLMGVLGGAAGGLAVIGAAVGISGRISTQNTLTANDDALAGAELSPTFDYGACNDAARGSDSCDNANKLETDGYTAAAYHKDLLRGLRLESAGAALGGSAAGVLIGSLPGLARTQRVRTVGVGVMISLGVAAVVAGGVLVAHTNADLKTELGGYAAYPDEWRADRQDYAQMRLQHVVASAVIGVGSGAIVGAGTAIVVLRPQRKHDRPAAYVLFSPSFGGAVLSGRF
jgi:hypothetical protein